MTSQNWIAVHIGVHWARWGLSTRRFAHRDGDERRTAWWRSTFGGLHYVPREWVH